LNTQCLQSLRQSDYTPELPSIYNPVQWDPRTKVLYNCLAGSKARAIHTCSDLDTGVWIYWIAYKNLHSRYPCLRCLVSRAVIGHLSASAKGSRFVYC
jgi:hypothetical protein